MALTKEQVESFNKDGYVKIEDAVPLAICEEIKDILWRDMGVDRTDRSTWTKPVMDLGFIMMNRLIRR